jgi:hypothetical protein
MKNHQVKERRLKLKLRKKKYLKERKRRKKKKKKYFVGGIMKMKMIVLNGQL